MLWIKGVAVGSIDVMIGASFQSPASIVAHRVFMYELNWRRNWRGRCSVAVLERGTLTIVMATNDIDSE